MQYSDVTPNSTGTVKSKFKRYFYTVTIHQQNKYVGIAYILNTALN